MEQGAGLMGFLPIIIIQQVMLAIFWKLAARVAMNKILYVVLMIIPLIGYFMFIYLLVRGMVMVLDKLDALQTQSGTNG